MEVLGTLDPVVWIVGSIFLAGTLIGWYFVLSVQGDMLVDDTKRGVNSNEEAVAMFLDLVRQARKSIDIHDDGDNTKGTVYNNQEVLDSLRRGFEVHDLRVRCLFNDNEPIALADLAREYPDNLAIWYARAERPENDTHYKIVDDGMLVHLSQHRHRDSERRYAIRKGKRWAPGTRRRISRAFREHFEHGLADAVQLET